MIEINATDVVYRGGSQDWYGNFWWRKAGCGPVNASNLMWYLARSRPEYASLWNAKDGSRESFLALMNKMFHFVKPGILGVNKISILIDGVLRFAHTRGIDLRVRSMEVSADRELRPKKEDVALFIRQALADDLPVAFLNLSNGKVTNLDSWHWVTLIALDCDTMTATMIDQGNCVDIDLGLWLETTSNGGGFVTFE